jgi:uncharacterized pyridoxamine 5'-phosphate oxidase family protein
MTKCSICGKVATFKIKGEKIYYCTQHAKEFFQEDALEKVKEISKGARDANFLKEYLKKNNS